MSILTNLAIEPLDPKTVNIPEISASEFLHNALNTGLTIIGALALVIIIVAGITYVLSGGEEAKITKAKSMITSSVIGLIVIVCAFAIVNFVFATF